MSSVAAVGGSGADGALRESAEDTGCSQSVAPELSSPNDGGSQTSKEHKDKVKQALNQLRTRDGTANCDDIVKNLGGDGTGAMSMV